MPARIFGQRLHLILVVFPLGLLATSFLFDLAWLTTGRATLALAARNIMLAGILGSVVAIVEGAFEWVAIPRGTRASHIGALHGVGTLIVTLLFAVSWFLRADAPAHPAALEIALSASGVVLTLVTGWLGSEVADRLAELGE